MIASECWEALGRERVDITPENPLSWGCQSGGIRVPPRPDGTPRCRPTERTLCMSDIPAFLVGVIPLVLVVGLVCIILRAISPHNRPPGRNTPPDGHIPRCRHIVPTQTRPRRSRLFPTLRRTNRDEKKSRPQER
jgi:hypothetical protein